MVDLVVPGAVDEAGKNLKQTESRTVRLSRKYAEARSLNATLGLKLDELRRKILRAKQAASSVSLLSFFLSFLPSFLFPSFLFLPFLPLSPFLSFSFSLTYSLAYFLT